LFQQGQQRLLNGEPGYNVSPEEYFQKYTHIGKNQTFVTTKDTIAREIGQFEGGSNYAVAAREATRLETGLGLERGSLADGFRISKVEGVAGRSPSSPIVGNQYFRGSGQGLPNGGTEMLVERIPTAGGSGITQIQVRILEYFEWSFEQAIGLLP
jgi:hypothetical protein